MNLFWWDIIIHEINSNSVGRYEDDDDDEDDRMDQRDRRVKGGMRYENDDDDDDGY